MKSFVITKLLIALILLGACFTNVSAQGTITTYAGNGLHGETGDGGPATLAQIGGPIGVCMDNAGNVYFVDTYGFIRRVSATTNVISTVAGTVVGGYSGEGGPAPLANIGTPSFITIDPAGNILFTTNQTIGKISPSGNYTIIAGSTITHGSSGDYGSATSALLEYPHGIITDAAGNIYFSQVGNNCIRKITASTGIITTIAGGSLVVGYSGDGGPATAASLNCPVGISFDSDGNILFADQGNGLIRKVDLMTGIITRVAGVPGVLTFSGNNVLATNAGLGHVTGICCDTAGNIYLNGFDAGHYCCKINAGTNIISIIAGDSTMGGYGGDGGLATMGLLEYPIGVCIDNSNGDIFIAENGGGRVRKISNSATLSVANEGNCHIDEPTIYPNPTNGIVSIRVTDAMKYAQASVFNVSGIVVFEAVLKDNETVIDLSAQPTGIYFLSVKSAHGNYIKQITVSK